MYYVCVGIGLGVGVVFGCRAKVVDPHAKKKQKMAVQQQPQSRGEGQPF